MAPLSCASRTGPCWRRGPRPRPARRGPARRAGRAASAWSSTSTSRRRGARTAPIWGSGPRWPPWPSLSSAYRRRSFQDVDLHPEPAVLALELQDPVLLGCAVARGARRAGRVCRLDLPLHGALAEAVLAHGLAPGLSGVVEVDYLPLELVGEMPRVPGVPHIRASRLLPSPGTVHIGVANPVSSAASPTASAMSSCRRASRSKSVRASDAQTAQFPMLFLLKSS